MVKPHSSHAAPRRHPVAGDASHPDNAAPEAPRAETDAPRAGAGALEPSMFMLPYLEVSRALLRAHHDALAMMEANRTLADALRLIVRRQQDLAFEIAEQAMARPAGEAQPSPEDRATIFHRAAEAVRELGEAMITAQLAALDTLHDRVRMPELSESETATRH